MTNLLSQATYSNQPANNMCCLRWIWNRKSNVNNCFVPCTSKIVLNPKNCCNQFLFTNKLLKQHKKHLFISWNVIYIIEWLDRKEVINWLLFLFETTLTKLVMLFFCFFCTFSSAYQVQCTYCMYVDNLQMYLVLVLYCGMSGTASHY